MDEVVTKDGSVTFFNEEFQEHYHSTAGAEEEALKKFAEPMEPYILGKESLLVLDVCFGLGYNTAAFIDVFAGKHKNICVYAFENDRAILEKILQVKTKFAFYGILQTWIGNVLSGDHSEFRTDYKGSHIRLRLFFGDVEKEINEMEHANAVLFDPFSPKKHPALWSKEFLSDVWDAMDTGAVLTTYSCARTFRDTLREIGFQVINGPCIGRKAPSTIAWKTGYAHVKWG